MAFATVLFDYEAEQPDELTLTVGQVVSDVNTQDGGWWEGTVNGKRGMFPENFVVLNAEDGGLSATKEDAKSIKQAKVTFQYEPDQDDELALEVGDIIEVYENDDGGWWKGKIREKVGMFPSNFVELLEEEQLIQLDAPSDNEQSTESKNERPRSVVGAVGGFGLKLEDLSRDKLKKVGKTKDALKLEEITSKPTQLVSPMEPNKPKEEVKIAVSPAQSPVIAPPSKTVQKAKATFVYEAELEDELTLAVGDIITITNLKVFDGWLEGELKGKVGLFPDNFVEMLPIETLVESSMEVPRSSFSKKSVRRAAKESPVKQEPEEEKPVEPEPPKPVEVEKLAKPAEHERPKSHAGFPLFPGGGGGLREELEKKLSQKPLDSKRPSKDKAPPPPTGKKPKPALPALPKPKSTPKPEKPALPGGMKPTVAKGPHTGSFSGSRPTSVKERNIDTTLNNGKPEPIDLDSVKPTDQLKHMQRAKVPGKNPPSKLFKDDNGEMEELRFQVSALQEKMGDMEKRFKRMMAQLMDDLDGERKVRLSQQVEIDRLKKQLNFLNNQ